MTDSTRERRASDSNESNAAHSSYQASRILLPLLNLNHRKQIRKKDSYKEKALTSSLDLTFLPLPFVATEKKTAATKISARQSALVVTRPAPHRCAIFATVRGASVSAPRTQRTQAHVTSNHL